MLVRAQKIGSNAYIFNALGIIAQKSKKTQESLAYYDQALHLMPLFSECLSNKASALMVLNQNVEAQRLLERAIEIDPNNPEAHNNLGVLHYKSNKFDLAQKEYMEAIKIRVFI